MPRLARLKIAGCPSHVIQRGVNRAACFFDDKDRRVYLNLLKVHAQKHECAVHAYVLMTNHVHLLVTPREADGLSNLMKALGERYVPFFNRAHRRTGTLWEGRFKSCLVESDSYLLTCQRYIELNPVRAEMVTDVADYPWSSYAINATGTPSDLIRPHDLYLALGNSPAERARTYHTRFGFPTDAETQFIRDSTNGGFVLSNAAFANALEEKTGVRVSRGKPGRPRKTAEKNESKAETLLSRGNRGLSLF